VSVGFEVVPHLQDDRFTLDLTPHQDTFSQQGYRIQQRGISSTVSGRLRAMAGGGWQLRSGSAAGDGLESGRGEPAGRGLSGLGQGR